MFVSEDELKNIPCNFLRVDLEHCQLLLLHATKQQNNAVAIAFSAVYELTHASDSIFQRIGKAQK